MISIWICVGCSLCTKLCFAGALEMKPDEG
jgi:formate hydrogenlyase subunit 6/NADH:ubiquinone oxidoreductase subunit I